MSERRLKKGGPACPHARVQGGYGGEHEGNDPRKKYEHEVPDLGTCHVSHEEEDRQEGERLPHVRLQDDQADGNEGDQKAKKESRQLADSVADAGEIRREKEDRRELHELGGLDADLGEPQP